MYPHCLCRMYVLSVFQSWQEYDNIFLKMMKMIIGFLQTPQRYWVQSSHWSPSVCQQKAVCPLSPWWTPLRFLRPSRHISPGHHAGIIQLLTVGNTNPNRCMVNHTGNWNNSKYICWWCTTLSTPTTESQSMFSLTWTPQVMKKRKTVILYIHRNNCTHITAVQCRLSTHGQQDAIWTLNLDDFSHKFWGDRQEVDRVGLLGAHLIGLNRGNVWVHEHCFQVLLLKHHDNWIGIFHYANHVTH